ncbi:MAG TPA: hypothetical protein VGD07_22740 [Methylomirabilota bacterium]
MQQFTVQRGMSIVLVIETPELERRRRLAMMAHLRPPRLPPGVTTFHEIH